MLLSVFADYRINDRFSSGAEVFPLCTALYRSAPIQIAPGGKVSILRGHSVGHSKQKGAYVHVSYSERFPR
jgi:hypothetical protein